ncbi:hypothetical protein MRB53_021167 [Persea americana]|uniref:Uncharacterized protein n=1 Tax=Persea americana TaxID=3435 RepID=A0ACC2L3M6_PERAE|nr:hypothetical protein MRB53_021167 [Persea americana]
MLLFFGVLREWMKGGSGARALGEQGRRTGEERKSLRRAMWEGSAQVASLEWFLRRLKMVMRGGRCDGEIGR